MEESVTRTTEVTWQVAYVWIIGNLVHSSPVELSTITLHAAKVVAVLHAAIETQVTSRHVGTVGLGQPVLVGFEGTGGNLILHDHNVGVGNNILAVRHRKDVSRVDKANSGQGQTEELAEDSHHERGVAQRRGLG